jgi:hypothetical protein
LPNYAIIRKWELLEQVDDEKIIKQYERLLELIEFHKTILASERNTENKVAV